MRVAVLVVALLASACSRPWLVAQAALNTADSALEQAEPLIPQDAEGREQALDITRAALELGHVAADVWQGVASPAPPTGWTKWIDDALRGAAAIMDILKAAGVPIPATITAAVLAIQALLPQLVGG